MAAPRYIALAYGAGVAAAHAGQFVTPAPRTFASAAHAQLANPTGRLHVAEYDAADADILHIVARAEYPVTLQEFRTAPPSPDAAEGAIVLRDLGPRGDGQRWATHWRNDETGGLSGGAFFDTYPEAVAHYVREVARIAHDAIADGPGRMSEQASFTTARAALRRLGFRLRTVRNGWSVVTGPDYQSGKMNDPRGAWDMAIRENPTLVG